MREGGEGREARGWVGSTGQSHHACAAELCRIDQRRQTRTTTVGHHVAIVEASAARASGSCVVFEPRTRCSKRAAAFERHWVVAAALQLNLAL